MKNLYVGASGLLWGLQRLVVRRRAETRLDLGGLGRTTLDLFRARPDFIRG